MHETGIVKSLLRRAEAIAHSNGAAGIETISVRIGALCPFSEGHLREHFELESMGTAAEGASLVVEHGTDLADPWAQDLALVSLVIREPLAAGGQPASDG